MIALWKDERRRAMLTALVLLSVAACSDDGAEGGANGKLAAPKQVVNVKSGDDASTGTADRARPVRIGTAGSDSGRCEVIGRVGNLPGGDDNFLAVREGPTPRTRELARLDPGARIYLCDRNADGKWLGVVYRPTGGLPEGDGCALQAAEGGVYDGPCRSGWVSARYVMPERHVMEGSEKEIAAASQLASDGAAVSGAMARREDATPTVSYYFCEIAEGISRFVFERRRTQGIERGYYLSPVFQAEPAQRDSLAEKYRRFALRTQNYDLDAKLGAPVCFEFSDHSEAKTVREEHRADYDASPKFETIENFWSGK